MNDDRIFDLLAQHQGAAEMAPDFADTLFERLQAERRQRIRWLAGVQSLSLGRTRTARVALLLAVVALLLAATVIGLALSSAPQVHPIAAVGDGSQLVVVYSDGSQRTVFHWPAHVVAWDREGDRVLFTNYGGVPRAAAAYVVRADGSGLRAILSLGGIAGLEAADWSPDGARIALATTTAPTSSQEGFKFSIVVVDPDRPDASPITLDGRQAKWSPDGSSISLLAGVSPAGAGQTMLVATAPGWNPVQVAEGETSLELVAWSPDSRWLLYRTWDDVGQPSLWIVRPDGSERRRLFSGDGAGGRALWLPDADAIAVDGPWEGPTDTIEIVDVTGASKRIAPKVDSRVYQVNLMGGVSDLLIWQASGAGFSFLASTSVADQSSELIGDVRPAGQLSWDRDELLWVAEDRECLEWFLVNGGKTGELCLDSNYDPNEVRWVGQWETDDF